MLYRQLKGDRFAPLAMLVYEGADVESMVTDFNKTVSDTVAELLGKLWIMPTKDET